MGVHLIKLIDLIDRGRVEKGIAMRITRKV